MKKIISLFIAILLLSSTTAVFADELSDVIIVSPIKENVLTLDADITDIIGGKKVELNMSLEINNDFTLTLGGNEYIKYTLDGSSPENGEYYYYESGPVSPEYHESYTNKIILTEAGTYTLRAVAYKNGCISNEYTTKIQVEKISTPTMTAENNIVTIKTNTNGAAIYYTIDGEEPSTVSEKYTEPVYLEESALLQAFAVKKGYATSEIGKEYIEIEEKKDSYAECNICGDEIAADDAIYDEGYNLICQECYDGLQNDDEELTYMECFYCGEVFGGSEDNYDEDGYAICPYCDEYINDIEENVEETKIEFITSDWAAEEVYEAYQNNLIPEEMLEDSLYETISREEFAAIAVKLYENLTGKYHFANISGMPFVDCDYESKYISYIAAAYELGITKGTSQWAFSPYDNISREQLATMLYRAINLAGINSTYGFDADNVRKFYDDSEISDYAKESVDVSLILCKLQNDNII